MEKEQRSRLQKATQDARKLLEEEFRSQLLQTYDIDVEKVRWAEEPGAHLQAEQRLIREKLVAWIEHKEAQIHDRKEALLLALREMAFTALNRFVALKLMEARELVRPCVSGGLESAGFLEFTAVAQGLLADQESSYRLYLETIFEDVSRELRALFDPRDPASLLWPKRAALLELLEILNRPELAELWIEDETLGWVYQYFNGDAERKKMREESSAPRNSRELAVRNQFFTPRYVVEFLTDNTLGRIWYEMRQGNTGLKDQCRYLVRRPNEVWLQPGEEPPAQADADEALSQEELLRQPVYIPHRPLKDPREIRMLDPACGSMHFGLYAFDLYLEIYSEAWEIAKASEEQVQQGDAFVPFVSYAAGFADKAAFVREVPRLILRYNIHGIDIDPRATQIARLTLWLRAQRAWRDNQLEATDRPRIHRSSVVCAEPMPGERELLGDFVDQQFPEAERGLVQQLLEVIFDKMQLAGEAGSLLRIEEEIRDAIDQARTKWQDLAVHQRDLFSSSEFAALGHVVSSVNSDLQGLSTDFWIDIEERIYLALSEYARHVEGDGGYQRRLFAEDAAQGFAFIDVCRKRYDVALMNPPFGDASTVALELLDSTLAVCGRDIGAAFVREAALRWTDGGKVGFLLATAPWFKPVFEKWRETLFLGKKMHLDVSSHLAGEVLDDATVTASPMVLTDSFAGASVVFRLTRENDIEAALWDCIDSLKRARSLPQIHLVNPIDVCTFPGRPFCYWISSQLRRNVAALPPFEGYGGTVKQGTATADEARFSRAWWEVPAESAAWIPYTKSSTYSPYWDDITWVGMFHNGLREILATGRARVQGVEFFGRPGVTYPSKAVLGFNPRLQPEGSGFGHSGSVAFSNHIHPLALLGFLGSRPVEYLLSLFIGELQGKAGVHPNHYEVGTVQRIPWPGLSVNQEADLRRCAGAAVGEVLKLHQQDETTRSFVIPFSRVGIGLGDGVNELAQIEQACLEKLCAHRKEADFVVGSAYEFTSSDFQEMEEAFANRIPPAEGRWRIYFGEQGSDYNSLEYVCRCISWLLGVSFGRWSCRPEADGMAIDEEFMLKAPSKCAPGQLQNEGGLPARLGEVPVSYPISVVWGGILVDDRNHPLDLVGHVCEAIEITWRGQDGGPTAEDIQREACSILGVQSLREYFRKPAGFFADHLKRYSKSRRQAPIYWQLSAGSGSYSTWLYYQRFTQDTIYRVLRDFVEPRILQADRESFELESQGALSGDAASRLQEAQTLLQDLRIFKSELDLVAPLWNPNLNDGVILNHAILWRITPYTPWQKKCKECWDKLVKGDYDWAHLAFHLWPERVIPKCTTDRSLAIAHGLEEQLWQETNNGNWLPRQLSEADLQSLIAKHSNPAVKSALERFLAAPPPVALTRTRASRSTRASGVSTPRRARGNAAVVDAEATRQVLLALSAAPSDGLAKAAIADLIGVEANVLTAVIKQLKESGQIDQLGERRGARYVLSEQGRAVVAADAGGDE